MAIALRLACFLAAHEDYWSRRLEEKNKLHRLSVLKAPATAATTATATTTTATTATATAAATTPRQAVKTKSRK